MKRKMTMFFLTKMMMGTMMAMSSKKWFLMWMGLETKTMSMLPILLSKKKRRKMEASMKYFMMQALAAAMMLKSALMKMWKKGSWLMKTPMKKMSSMTMMMALFFKMSMAPFHFWFPEVIKGMKLTKGLMLTTWQKMAPTIMTMKMMEKLKKKMMMTCTTLSMIMGSWKGMKQTQTRKMMAFSSMNHMGWIILMSMFKQKTSLIMMLIYIMIKSAMFTKLMKKKTTKISSTKKKKMLKPWKASTLSMLMLSLGGLPPLTGFMKKILSIKMLVKKENFMLTMPLMLGSLMSLFFYLRMAFKTNMTKFPQKSLMIMKLRKKKKKKMKSMLKTMSILGMILTPIVIKIMK